MTRKEYQDRYYAKKPWAKTLSNIKTRCEDEKRPYYKNGIKNFLIIEEIKSLWFRDKAYLMRKPSIDRLDNKGDYVLSNCRFIEFGDNVRRSEHLYKKGHTTWNKGKKMPRSFMDICYKRKLIRDKNGKFLTYFLPKQ